MKAADFDFELPAELIALRPAPKRDGSRLLVLGRDGGIEHKAFSDIAGYMEKGDMLVLNDTKVLPVRLLGAKPSGGRVDIILVREDREGAWEILCKGNYEGRVHLRGGVTAELFSASPGPDGTAGGRYLRFIGSVPANIREILELCGSMPLPPYIKRLPDDEDRQRYQTVYADRPGSIAAPTAGLHFTKELLDLIESQGVLIRHVTLHVGPGTFKPVTAEYISDHRMLPEYFEMEAGLPSEIREVKASGRKVITVGTTATRALEGLLGGKYCPGEGNGNGRISGYTDIFISPGHNFAAPDALLTNFHLPHSTPLMLAAAFAGLDKLMEAYREAVAGGYRFFSYGDAMLIL
jgi:S-adenosylmethionine:tRNA ribosyltransferase-isomerase